MDLSVAFAAIVKARAAIEDNADAHPLACGCTACPGTLRDDGATLRLVYHHLLTASAGVTGAIAILRLRGEMAEALESETRRAPTLRIVK